MDFLRISCVKVSAEKVCLSVGRVCAMCGGFDRFGQCVSFVMDGRFC
jgi:hypothetical protein